MASPELANKGEEANDSLPAPQASIPFGRSQNSDASNKHVNEVEKCSAGGSVAQKKAFFEAHSRNVAARKVEPSDQEKPTKTGDGKLGGQSPRDLTANIRGITGEECGAVKQNITATQTCAANSNVVEESIRDALTGQSSIEKENDESDKRMDSPKLKEPDDETDSLKEYSYSVGSQRVTEALQGRDNEKVEHSKVEAEIVRLDLPRASLKKTLPIKVEHDVATAKNKSLLSIPISPQTSAPTPRGAKLISSFTAPVSALQSSARKGNGLSLTRSHDSSVRQHKKTVPTATENSSSLDSARYAAEPTPSTPARHFSIMQKMGDKEIVRRAFKTFQKDRECNQLNISVEDRLYAANQVPVEVAESRVSTPRNPQKEHESSPREGRADPIRRSSGGAKSTFSLRSDERAEKQEKHKQVVKRLEVKSNAIEGEKLRLRSKPKNERGRNQKLQTEP